MRKLHIIEKTMNTQSNDHFMTFNQYNNGLMMPISGKLEWISPKISPMEMDETSCEGSININTAHVYCTPNAPAS
jgi:hypothetical protein